MGFQWSQKAEFGTLWSLLSTSMNVAGTTGPMLGALVTLEVGWRASMQIFGKRSIDVEKVKGAILS